MFNFNVFSRRNKKNMNTSREVKPLTPEFRNRFLLLMNQTPLGFSIQDLMEELRLKMMMNLGRAIGNPTRELFHDYTSDMFEYLFSCPDEYFFDALEYMFETRVGVNLIHNEKLIEQINQFFDLDDLPYKLTQGKVDYNESTDEDGFVCTSHDITYPKVVRKDSSILNDFAIEPVLTLLRKPEYKNANAEFLLALEDYRHRKYRDAVTKSCSSFESVMKVVCKQRRIKLKGHETASPLIDKILEDAQLPSFFKQPLLSIATIRNKLGIAHGSGSEEKVVSESIALYSINATASAILLVTGDW
ncbi:abortive infection family protein [Vibrio alginolyticus]|uniref:abortive infection family protein n=1 Tax=Vibrio alginolyticus TaxID=663 RepID=UPI00215C1196|nr:abortive infection family protein [Vibrio alginolyticus]EJE4689029.1 hypothetical protein [Vibrio parahaemolyticus]EJK2425630.1 hypothetical protein [Vibrio parahaemolyticus]ELA9413386.1 hypothetical protein [Vibrio parahaemolyticus]MCR9532736.1 abortive infection family protein [Vibrio alginolyticus]